jgi:hypothetical protein
MGHAWESRVKCTGFCWESQKERDHLEDQGVDVSFGSEWILGILIGECTMGSVGSGKVPVAGSCEYGDEPACSGATELIS